MPKVLIAKLNGREIARYILSTDNFFHIKAESGYSYELINEQADVINKKVKVKVENDDLVLMLEGEALAVIDDFYHSNIDVRFQSDSERISHHAEATVIEGPPGPPPSDLSASEQDSSDGLVPPFLFASGAGGGGLALANSHSSGSSSRDNQSGSNNDNDDNGGSGDNGGNGDNGGANPPPVDNTGPTAIITLDRTTFNAGDVGTVTITFSEAVNNLTLADFNADTGALSALNTADNITWTATFTPTALTPLVNNNEISLNTNYTDLSGNPGAAALSPTYDVDTTTADVIFDLSTGRGISSDSGGRMFQAGVQYDIYIMVNSNNGALTFDPLQIWTQAGNLGADDTVTLVGSGVPIRFIATTTANPVIGSFANSTPSTGYAWTNGIFPAAALVALGAFARFTRPTVGAATNNISVAIWSAGSPAPQSFILTVTPFLINPPNMDFANSLPTSVSPLPP